MGMTARCKQRCTAIPRCNTPLRYVTAVRHLRTNRYKDVVITGAKFLKCALTSRKVTRLIIYSDFRCHGKIQRRGAPHNHQYPNINCVALSCAACPRDTFQSALFCCQVMWAHPRALHLSLTQKRLSYHDKSRAQQIIPITPTYRFE